MAAPGTTRLPECCPRRARLRGRSPTRAREFIGEWKREIDGAELGKTRSVGPSAKSPSNTLPMESGSLTFAAKRVGAVCGAPGSSAPPSATAKADRQAGIFQLVHNVWDAQGGYAKARAIHTRGREDQVDAEALRRLVRNISRFLSPEQALSATASSELRFIGSRPFGGAYVIDALWHRLGISETEQPSGVGAGHLARGGAAHLHPGRQSRARPLIQAGGVGVGGAGRGSARRGPAGG